MRIIRIADRVAVSASILFLLGGNQCCRAGEAPPDGMRQTLSFDQDWRFHPGEVDGGQTPALVDDWWRTMEVPHGSSIEGPPGADPAMMAGPFEKKSSGGTGAGALNGGIGCYRKSFSLPEDSAGKCVELRFDGVYSDSEIRLKVNAQDLQAGVVVITTGR